MDARRERLTAGLRRHLPHGRLGVLEACEGAGVRVDGRPEGLLPEAALHVGRDEQACVGVLLEADERLARLRPAAVEQDQPSDGVPVQQARHGVGVLGRRAGRRQVVAEADDEQAGDFFSRSQNG